MWSYEAFHAMPEQSEAYLQESLNSDLSDIEGTYIARDNKEGELRRLSVKDTHRRFGVGRSLIDALEKWAQENGFRKVWLTTAGVMDKAIAFYPSVGFKHTAVIVVSEDPYFEVYRFENLLRSSDK
ncbi:Acetyltransferase (GNAT) family [Phytophthora infestans]|uniref:Acetyltransferase (GNAT) family n=1 Tax=Phytophthora infestans TaxID=4787 RepID=A0A833TDS2_PHYIN|nr:Acetyltransferase (GNAT) family [Phytophthora infestans]KAF4148253.1 Acetyltransferase (GNAT) family [Phytophthora infestans]